MTSAVDAPVFEEATLKRVLGSVRGETSGPTLLCVGGIHGNEPAGVLALRSILAELERDPSRICGEFVGLAGNLRALGEGRRYIDRDLNRAWTEERTDALREGVVAQDAEDHEQHELLIALEQVRARARGAMWVVDLHTTSGSGGVFTTVSDRLPNRQFALAIPAPLVLGLEEQVDGTLMDFLDREGVMAMSFESGQHTEPIAVQRAVNGIWLTLAHAGCIDPESEEVTAARDAFREEFAELPSVVEMRYRHGLEHSEGFQMLEGYQNFQEIRADELLGHDDEGDVRAPRPGLILMPLYQLQGGDGFFIVREFNAFWLAVSGRLRRWRFDRFVHWLPGVKRVEARPGALYVNRGVARWFALELLHLLGYRRVRAVGKRLIVIKRGPLVDPNS
jgi:predicted deacylase